MRTRTRPRRPRPRATFTGRGTACPGRSRWRTAPSIRISPTWRFASRQIHKEWKDVWLGVEFGSEVEIGHGQVSKEIKGDQKVGPGEDIELLWVEEATDVAKSAAEKSGWGSVPWEELVQEVLKIG